MKYRLEATNADNKMSQLQLLWEVMNKSNIRYSLQQWKQPKGLEYSKVSFCLIVHCKTTLAASEKIK